MFCGIVEEIGVISGSTGGPQGARLTIQGTAVHEGLREGESVAVSGVCLTVTTVNTDRFAVDVSPETLRVTTFGTLSIGALVNLERSMTLDQRIDGHLVSGHVDGIGTIVERNDVGNSIVFQISVDKGIMRHCIVKGSVAVDGVSLTINQILRSAFEVAIIPHTAEMTTFGSKNVGDSVNIETDMIGKYIERLYISSRY
ncbi:MAG: riboflavin synthase [Nitrospiraceae bacterium]|jgi:riboflavin synthase|nr:riboflavin synthase [Nitrospiraceae bacterium]|tara:strand:- start:2878 stop:3474 length:597 start_codon:yes stop_codon:yes gene_type:complete